MLMEPLPSIAKVYSVLIQEEGKSNNSSEEPKVLAISGYQGRGGFRGRGDCGGRSGGGRGGRSPKTCSYCGRTGHTVDICYKKHGYPPHFQQNFVNNCATEAVNETEEETSHHEEQSVAAKQAPSPGKFGIHS